MPSTARDPDVVDDDDGRVTSPLHLHGNGSDEILVAILNPRMDQPHIAADFRDADDGVFILLVGAKLLASVLEDLDWAPAPAHGGLGEGGFEFRFQLFRGEGRFW